MTDQIRARYGRFYALAITMLAAVAVAGTVWAGNGQQSRIDVSTMMTNTDVGTLPVQDIKDAF